MKMLLSGNEAIARGAYEAGVTVAAAYPGTPSTEILENLARYPEIYTEWSPNEKIALEVGIGASLGGARVLVAMKHVGVNVAADPLLTFSYTGVGGGLVLISADDPGMHSSQNEQDNRYYAKFAKIPMLEPSNSQEAGSMVGIALSLSERFGTPVMLRTTTRVSHCYGLVEYHDPQVNLRQIRPYKKNIKKYVMIPAYARIRHPEVERRLQKLKKYAEQCELNTIEWGDRSVGIVTSGVCYQYAKEVFPGASYLKLGFTFPLPEHLIRDFAAQVDTLLVIEELEPYLEDYIKGLGLKVLGKELFSYFGEFNPDVVSSGLAKAREQGLIKLSENRITESRNNEINETVVNRPPVMCPGCPHRAVFYVLRKLGMTVTGDIGCYTLSCQPPLEAMDSTICMGASIGMAIGMQKANPNLKGKIVATIGDSTFYHSGITGLMDAAYNQAAITVIILDNGTTAMTGHQNHPGTGVTLKGDTTQQVDLEALVAALGIKEIAVVDPFDLDHLQKAIKYGSATDGPSVIIARRVCVLRDKSKQVSLAVVHEHCKACGLCLSLGCPAISRQDNCIDIDPALCSGCGLCAKICKHQAIAGAV